MELDRFVPSVSIRILMLFCAAAFLLGGTVPAFAAHKLAEENCYDCHAVGGAKDMVITGTQLIKKDARMVEIINGGWQVNNHLPCVYCHDDSTIRTNKVAVKNHFSDYSLSKHPVDLFVSNDVDDGGALDCVDCHTNVTYVDGGLNRLNPDIHAIDTSAVGWTTNSQLIAASTFYTHGSTLVSPYNADGNVMCSACHDTNYPTPIFLANSKQHSYTAPGILSLEGSSFTTTIQGCLSTDGAPTGCHDIHNSPDNVSLITVKKSDGTRVERDDCGICHTFDDPPSNRAGSDFYGRGHGRFQATSNIVCTTCHDVNDPHFNADGTITGDRLSFYVDTTQKSGLSDPQKTLLSNCVSSNCHADKFPHGGSNVQVGCLDCHDPHGYGVGSNITMVRNAVPVASPSGSLYYGTAGAYFDSTFMGTTNFSGWLCDNADCHGVPTGPGPIASIMSTSPANTTPHTGGVGYTGNCDSCHFHDNTTGSFGASDSCTTCHGQPPSANYGSGPDGFATGYADSGHFKAEDKTPHALHAGTTGYGYSCEVCHIHGPDSSYHNTSTSNPETFRNVVFNAQINTNVLPEGPNKYSPSYSINATTPNVCLNLYCHGDGQGVDRYNTAVVLEQAWDDDVSTTLSCEGCHGSNRTDAAGTSYFGAPDYANGGSGDAIYSPGSGISASSTKANSHIDTTKHGRYNCSVCHNNIITDTNPADGWTINDRTRHVNQQIEVVFDGGVVVSGTWDSTTKTCSSVWCHNTASPQWGQTTTCTSCHNNGTNDGLLVNAAPLTGQHAPHIANTVYVSNCESCHGTGANSGDQVGHVDQSASFGSQVSAYIDSTGTCTNNCHGVVDGRDWTSGTTLDCVDCHNNAGGTLVAGGVTAAIDSITGPPTGRHSVHLDNATYIPNDCVDCHGHKGGPSATVPTHIDGPTVDDITMAAEVGTWYAGTGGCANTCHLVDAALAGDWLDSPNALNCTDCHSATGLRLERGWPPDQGQHVVHRNNTAYVDSGVGDCVDCHNDNNAPNTHSTLDSVVTSPVLGTSISAFNGTDSTCVNICHLAGDTDEWLTGAILCTDCHSGSYIGGNSFAPASGLHAVTGTDANGQAFVPHDETLSAGRCANCHTATPSATHMDAVFDTPAAAFTSTINWAYDGTDSQSFCLGETTGCHVDGAKLYRLWDAAADCTICHGKDSAASIGGYEAPANDGGSNSGSFTYGHTSVALNAAANTTGGDHDACTDCHWGIGSTDAGLADHVDRGAISATLDVGYSYSRTTGKCSTNCHAGSGDIWLWQYTSNVPLNAYTTTLPCGQCHSNKGLPPTSGSHTAHFDAIAAGAGSDSDYTECETCHGPPLGGAWDAVGYPHQNGTVNFNTALVTYDNNATATTVDDDTCTTTVCHSPGGNPAVWGDAGAPWDSTGTGSSFDCDECHYWSLTP
ncbi:MAG: CxxxxCH/CxxCH domain-containing protein, partial [bacterium]|nr:CxxxxCH/CxxCH domain-containing protein [bacterium]